MYVVRDKLEVFIFKQEYGLTSPIFFSPKAIYSFTFYSDWEVFKPFLW